MKASSLVRVLMLVVVSIAMLPLGAAASSDIYVSSDHGGDKVDPYVLGELAARGKANIFVMLNSEADLTAAEAISDRTQRVQFVYDALTAHGERTQSAIKSFLGNRNIRIQSFWINNSVYVYGAKLGLIRRLAERDDVAYIRGDHKRPVPNPVSREAGPDQLNAVAWGVERINADDVWTMGYLGDGIVVANIDTGVRYTHDALVGQYRGNNGNGTFSHDYNWWDPLMNLAVPRDNNDHGTHTMGTMVGGDGPGAFTEDIGVAPGAEWIAAKGCGTIFCSDFRLTSSAQWITCPTKVDGSAPDCSKAPHIVNNSWGGPGGDDWYQTYTWAWLHAGIAPVFSMGNSGSACKTGGTPGDYFFVLGIGATDINDNLASFSSKGPGSFRRLKPDFVAPAVAVRSSVASSDSAYANFSGTSMSAPHMAGSIALMLSANPAAGFANLYNSMRTTTVTGLPAPPGPDTCGGRSYSVYPNFIYGWGLIDAAGAVAAVLP